MNEGEIFMNTYAYQRKEKREFKWYYAATYMVIMFATNQTIGSEGPMDYSFPKEEYEHYMQLIKEIDPAVHTKLRQCETAIGAPCIEEAVDIEGTVDFGSDETHGYPIIVIKSMKDYDEEGQKNILKVYIDWYNSIKIAPPITPAEQQKVMEILKSIDLTAYEAVAKVDPMGTNHIKRHYGNGASIAPSPIDGLPEIQIDAECFNLPIGELRFVMAHELAHYVLGHFFEEYQLSHHILAKEEVPAELKKGKTVSGKLPFKGTFENAFNRTKENEADRMAIIDFGINIDDGIALAKRWLLEAKEHEIEAPQKATFSSTHPLWASRIKYLESLRREVELNKTRKIRIKPINWQELAEQYMQKYASH